MNIRQSANMSKVEDAVHDLEAVFNLFTPIEVEITEGSNKIDEDGLRNIRNLERSE